MDESFRLGSLAGIRIGLNWSVLVIFALLVWTLATNLFPHHNGGLSDATYVGMAIAATLLFFASLLAHELGHALVARREGMEIEGITLWLFGGVARFRGMFPSAGAEFRIAIAGPLVTLVLGVAAVLLARASLPPAVDGVAAWLGYINLLLLGFNLLPALPLDGGRVLRAALWRARRDVAWATAVAAGIGRGFGYAMIAAGVFLFIFQGAFSGAWLAFIGWFLLMAAGDEARALSARRTLSGLTVGDLMARDPVTVSPQLTLGEFMDEVVWAQRYTTYPVVDGGRALGLLRFRSVAEVRRDEWDVRRVRDVMTPREHVPLLAEGDELVAALEALSESGVGRALVLEGERLVGLLSITDLTRALDVGPPRRPRPAAPGPGDE